MDYLQKLIGAPNTEMNVAGSLMNSLNTIDLRKAGLGKVVKVHLPIISRTPDVEHAKAMRKSVETIARELYPLVLQQTQEIGDFIRPSAELDIILEECVHDFGEAFEKIVTGNTSACWQPTIVSPEPSFYLLEPGVRVIKLCIAVNLVEERAIAAPCVFVQADVLGEKTDSGFDHKTVAAQFYKPGMLDDTSEGG